MRGTMLGTEDSKGKKTKSLPSGACILVRKERQKISLIRALEK